MKRSGVYFLGFVVLIIGLIYAVSNSGTRDNVIIDKDKN